MGAIGYSEYVTNADAGSEAERQELDWLLTSGVLGRSGNLARLLRYICEERFAGRAAQIKEYSIATEALGRRPDFDPNTDTIVRVTVHSLRKRLLEVYQNEGAARSMRLVLPPGHYAPQFVPAPQLPPADPLAADATALTHAAGSVALDRIDAQWQPQPSSPRIPLWSVAIVAAALAIAAAAVWIARTQQARLRPVEFAAAAGNLPLPPPQATIRALMGTHREPYVDHSGLKWTTGDYCQGGTSVLLPPQKIAGTQDAPLYLGGVRGIARCTFPVTQKLYELHFYFAETTDLAPATRVASLSINAAPAIGVDVVDIAGGSGTAMSRVVTGVAPLNDGAIHLDFLSDVSPLNAVEVIPTPSPGQLPVRIVASSEPYVDSAHQFWAADRYFSGGRFGMAPPSGKRANMGLYGSVRVGRFHYKIPAVPLARYRVRLYFFESWFGKENGGSGGPGSRVFDVSANGQQLLKDFDILAEVGSAPVVKTFDNIQANADGWVDLAFIPVKNYPIVSAIEVLPEPDN